MAETILYNCDLCHQGNMTEEQMRTHMMMDHTETKLICPFCDLSNVTPQEMNLHINSVHLDSSIEQSLNNVSQPDSQPKETYSLAVKQNNRNNLNVELIAEKYYKKVINNEIEITENSSDNLNETSMDVNGISDLKSVSNICSKSEEDKSYQCNNSYNTVKCATSGLREQISDENMQADTPFLNRVSKSMEIVYSCPICSFSSDCSETLNVHVNQAHFQDTPTKQVVNGPGVNDKVNGKIKKSSNLLYGECETLPYAKVKMQNTTNLSPVSSNSTTNSAYSETSAFSETNHSISGYCGFTPVKREPDRDGKLQCPFCDLEVAEDETLQFHINGSHLDEEKDSINKEDDETECPVCGETFGIVTEGEQMLTAHVNSHFSVKHESQECTNKVKESQMAQELQRRELQAHKFQQEKQQEKQLESSNSKTTSRTYKKTAEKNLEKAVVNGQMSITDFYTSKHEIVQANKTGVDEGTSCSKGIIPCLEQFYRQPNRLVTNHWLAAPTDHYAGSYGDRGWGCGYRNFQMLLSCLVNIPAYQDVLFNGNLKIPSIPKLQLLIEDAWRQGFDPQGKEQLKKVVNTSKWIGATEIYATLSSLKVKCQLVDFHSPTGKDGTHPRLFQWVKDYFSRAPGQKPSLYLQHQGHSRTIIGLEEYKDNTMKLLIYDPGTPKGQMLKFVRSNIDNNIMKSIRKTQYGLKARQYQIVAVTGILSEDEKRNYKLLRSDRVP